MTLCGALRRDESKLPVPTGGTREEAEAEEAEAGAERPAGGEAVLGEERVGEDPAVRR